MAIRILENCPACAACLPVCPMGALTLDKGKLTVKENCIECGLCVKQCPVKQLELPEDSPPPAGKDKRRRMESKNQEVNHNA